MTWETFFMLFIAASAEAFACARSVGSVDVEGIWSEEIEFADVTRDLEAAAAVGEEGRRRGLR